MTERPPALYLSKPELELALRHLPGVSTRPGENEVLRSLRPGEKVLGLVY